MNEFGFVRSDMAAAQASADDAVALARRSDGADALQTLAAALPGTQTAASLPTLGDLWRDGIHDWCDNAATYADSIGSTSQDGSSTDAGIGGWLWPFGGH